MVVNISYKLNKDMTVLAKLVTVHTNDKKGLCLAFCTIMFFLFKPCRLLFKREVRVYNSLREFWSLIWHYNLQFYDFPIRPGLFCHIALSFAGETRFNEYSNWLIQVWVSLTFNNKHIWENFDHWYDTTTCNIYVFGLWLG